MFSERGFSLVEVVIAFAITSIFLSSIYLVLQNAIFTMERSKKGVPSVLKLSGVNYAVKSGKALLRENLRRKVRGRDETCQRLTFKDSEFLRCPIRVKDVFGREHLLSKEYLVIFGEDTMVLGR